MKRIAMLLMIVSMIACQQNTADTGDFDLTGYESQKISGTSVTKVVKKDAEGKMLEEGFLRNGMKDGQWITYDAAKGSVQNIDSYVDGKLNGYSFMFSSRGYIEEQSGFINNELEGKHFTYRYGRPKSEASYKNGKMDGIQREYYDNGKLQQETEFKNGIQDGVYKYYSDDGILRMSYVYKNGEKVEGGIVENEEGEETTE
jgi:antitoxin component YwqK of YwqJK toxin-antitoxin module